MISIVDPVDILVQVKYEEASQIACDAVSNIRTVVSFCAESKAMNLYEKKCEGLKRQSVRLGIVSGLGYGFSFFALYCVNALCFYVGGVLIGRQLCSYKEFFNVRERKDKINLVWFVLCFC